MVCYPYACVCGHKFERLLSTSEDVSTQKCPGCGKPAKQDYAAKNIQRGMIDGEHSGYYPPEMGFPRDPNNPLKSICPPKRQAEDAMKRTEDRTQGAVGWIKP